MLLPPLWTMMWNHTGAQGGRIPATIDLVTRRSCEQWSISCSGHFTPQEDSQLYTSDSVGPRKKFHAPFRIQNPSIQGHSQLLPTHSNNKKTHPFVRIRKEEKRNAFAAGVTLAGDSTLCLAAAMPCWLELYMVYGIQPASCLIPTLPQSALCYPY